MRDFILERNYGEQTIYTIIDTKTGLDLGKTFDTREDAQRFIEEDLKVSIEKGKEEVKQLKKNIREIQKKIESLEWSLHSNQFSLERANEILKNLEKELKEMN